MPTYRTRGLALAAAGGVAAALWFGLALVEPTRATPRRSVALPAFDELRHGDVIFRSGVSADSALVRKADPGSIYSHAGLIDLTDRAAPHVVHVEAAEVPGESAVRREPLAAYLAFDRADGFAVFHLAGADRGLGHAAVAAALRYRAAGIAFDYRADLATEREQYCTEMIWRVYRQAGLDLLDGDFGPRPALLGRPAVRLTALQQSRYLVAGPASR
jgi:hypothetical protein